MAFFNPVDAPDDSGAIGLGGGILLNNASFPIATGDNWFPSAPGVGLPWFVGIGQSIIMQLAPVITTTCTAEIQFYSDVAGTVDLAGYFYGKFGDGLTIDQVVAPSPFMRFNLNNSSGFAGTANIWLAISANSGAGNGIGGLLAFPGRQAAVYSNPAQAPGTTFNTSPIVNIPGPAYMYVRTATAAVVEATIQTTGGPTAGSQICRLATSGAAMSAAAGNIILPNDDWEFRVTNNGAGNAIVEAAVLIGR